MVARRGGLDSGRPEHSMALRRGCAGNGPWAMAGSGGSRRAVDAGRGRGQARRGSDPVVNRDRRSRAAAGDCGHCDQDGLAA